jgi:feruloyl esterase
MLATYPDVFRAGSTFAGGAYGCSTSCAALGKKGQGWSWPGNHGAQLVTGAFPSVWQSASAPKPRLLIFQGDADGAVTPENLADLTQQWKGALGVTDPGTKSTLKGHAYTTYSKNGQVVLASVLMSGIGHGTPVDPGPGEDQGGWDPEPSQTMKSDANAVQDWTNSAGIYGPYYSAKFFGLVP